MNNESQNRSYFATTSMQNNNNIIMTCASTKYEDSNKEKDLIKMKDLENNAKTIKEWNEIISQYIDMGDPEKATEALFRAEEITQETPSLDVHTSIIDSCIEQQRIYVESEEQQQEEEEESSTKPFVILAAEMIELLIFRMDGTPMPTSLHFGRRSSPLQRKTWNLSISHYHKSIEAWHRVVLWAFLDVNPNKMTYPQWLRRQQRLTYAKGAPQRAQTLLNKMETSLGFSTPIINTSPQNHHHYEHEHEQASSIVNIYNLVAESWGKSYEHLFAMRTEQVLDELSSKSQFGLYPNDESHRIALMAWARHISRDACWSAMKHFLILHEKAMETESIMDVTQVKGPTLENCEAVLHAWSRSRYKHAYVKGLNILNIMDQMYYSRITNFRPNVACFRNVLLCMSSNNGQKANVAAIEAEKLLDKMINERSLHPDNTCFNAVIQAWTRSAAALALSPKPTTTTQKQKKISSYMSAKSANRILERMERMYGKSAVVNVRPTTKDYNAVLEALQICRDGGMEAALKAQELLDRMIEDDNLVPDGISFQYVILAWSKSGMPAQHVKAIELLRLMMKLVEERRARASYLVNVFNAVLASCANAANSVKDEKKRREVLGMAISIVEELKKYPGAGANSNTYASLLNTCRRHLAGPELEEYRETAAEIVFENCCKRGLVNGAVLHQFQQTVSKELFQEIILEGVESSENLASKVLPKEWTRKVLLEKSMDKKSMLLSINGTFTITKEMKDRKMKMSVLMSHKNKKLLQGGRTPLDRFKYSKCSK